MTFEYKPGLINAKHEIVLPEFRVAFHADRERWEVGRLDDCADKMKPGMVVYDVGAEHGDFTALYKKWVGESGDVIPIEPAAHYWPFIRGTWEANGFATPPRLSYVGLIGDKRDGPNHVSSYTWPEESEGEGVADGGFLHLAHAHKDVPRTTIDHLANYYAIPDAIVLDIEGAEWNALYGAQALLSEGHPLVWMSFHEDTCWNWYRKKLIDIHALMKDCGYVGEELPHHGEGETFWRYEAG